MDAKLVAVGRKKGAVMENHCGREAAGGRAGLSNATRGRLGNAAISIQLMPKSLQLGGGRRP